MKNKYLICSTLIILILACATPAATQQPSVTAASIDRLTSIPADAIKFTPQIDPNPPRSISPDYMQPIPLPGAVNTAGGEDSPFITPDSQTLYVWFTPDLGIPPEKQLIDGVSGIYVSRKTGEEWGEPQRILLQEPGKVALDGCEFVQVDVMWFCSAREGYAGINWFTARMVNNDWQDWHIVDFDPAWMVGELHISADGSRLYFASDRNEGLGGRDIWYSDKINGAWQSPVNLAAVNSERDDGWPALSPAGDELWITRDHGLWRSKQVDGAWQTPELIITSLAGEATIDAGGNVYFVHHFYQDGEMIEVDIYLVRKK